MPGGSQGSLVEIGPFWSDTRLGETKDGTLKSGSPVGCGMNELPCGPSSGIFSPVVSAQTR